MLEGIVASILSRYLGDFIIGLEGDNLSLNISGGHVVLENLQFKKECLAELELPITVKEGFLGKYSMEIPWSSLGSKPAIAVIDKVFLLVGPTQPSEYDPKLVKRKHNETKKRKLQVNELLAGDPTKETKKQPQVAEMEEEKRSYTELLIRTVVENFQVFIKKVHFRYEDDISNPNRKFAMGFTLENFRVESCDENWKPKFLKSEGRNFVHKIATVKNFMSYWSSDCQFLAYNNISQLGKLMENMIYEEGKPPALESDYILHPINGSLKLQLNQKEADYSIPKLIVELMFDQVVMQLKQKQWRDLIYMGNYFSYYSRGIKYHEYRPDRRIRAAQNPLKWWRFAIKSIIADVKEKRAKRTWRRLEQYKRDRLLYIHLWKKKLIQKKKVSELVLDQLSSLEYSLDYNDIVLFRSMAHSLIRRDTLQGKGDQSGSSSSWFGWVWGKKDDEIDMMEEIGGEDWRYIYNDINFLDEKIESEVDESYVQLKASFAVGEGSLELIGEEKKSEYKIIQAGFEGFQVDVEQRPKGESVKASILSVAVVDYYTLRDTKGVVEMVCLNDTQLIASDSFFSFQFDRNPIDIDADMRVCISALQSLNITFGTEIINRFIEFFKHESSASQLILTANNGWDSLREAAEVQVKYALDNRKVLELEIDIIAPNVMIPSNFHDPFASMLIIELGNLSMRSDTKNRKDAVVRSSSDLKVNQDFYYDKFVVKLSSIHMMVADRSFTEYSESNALFVDFIERFDISTDLYICNVKSPDLPTFRLSGSLPKLALQISPKKVGHIYAIIRSFIDGFNSSEELKQMQADLASAKQLLDVISPIAGKFGIKKEEKKFDNWLKLDFEFSDLNLSLHKDYSPLLENAQPESMQLIHATLKKLKLTYELTSYYMKASLIINALYMIDSIQPWHDTVYLISSEGDDKSIDLVSIFYVGISKTSPSFKSIEHSFNIHFDTLKVKVNRETVADLFSYLMTCFEEMNRSNKPDIAEATQRKQLTTSNNNNNTNINNSNNNNNSNSNNNDDNKVDSIILQVNLHVNCLKATLLKEGEKFLVSSLKDSVFRSSIHSNHEINLNGYLGNIRVRDYSPGTIWRDIVNIEAEDSRVVEFWFETVNPDPNDIDSLGKVVVTMQISSVRFVLLTRVLRSLWSYFTEFGAMQSLISNSYKKAEKTVTSNSSSKLILFDISVANPHVIIPKSSKERDYVVANLGDFAITNKLEKVEFGVMMDNIIIQITSISMYSVSHMKDDDLLLLNLNDSQNGSKLNNGNNSNYSSSNIIMDNSMTTLKDSVNFIGNEKIIKRDIIKETNIELRVYRAAFWNDEHQYPDYYASIKIKDITLQVSEVQFALLLDIFSGNLSEVPTHSKDLKNLQEKLGTELEAELLTGKHLSPSSMSLDYTKYKFKLQLHNTSLELQEREGGEKLSLIKMALEDLESEGSFSKNTKLEASINIRDIVITDTRSDNSNQFKNLIEPIKKQEKGDKQYHHNNHKIFLFTYLKDVVGNQSITIIVDTPRVVMLPDLLFKSKNYVLENLQRLVNTYYEMKKSIIDSSDVEDGKNVEVSNNNNNNNNNNNDGKEKNNDHEGDHIKMSENANIEDAPKTNINVKMKVIDPQVCLIEDHKSLDSRILVLRQSVDVDYTYYPGGKQNAVIFIPDILLYKCHFRSNDYIQILSPFTLHAAFEKIPNEAFSLVVDFTDIDIRISYTDFKLINKMRVEWMRVINGVELPVAPKVELAESSFQSKLLKRREVMIKPKLQLKQSSSTYGESIAINYKKIQIILLNDCYDDASSSNIPLLDLAIDEMSMLISNWSTLIKGHMSLVKLKVYYYNSTLNVKEPMIEPWDFVAYFYRRMMGGPLNVTLETTDPLDINVSKSFVETLLNNLEQWQLDFYDKVSPKRQILAPFYISNETGITLTYWITGTKKRITLESGVETPLDLSEIDLLNRKNIEMDLMISVQLEDDEFIPIHNLPILKKTAMNFDLTSKNNCRLYFSVDFRQGSRIITFGSDLIIINNTCTPLQVQLQNSHLATFYMEPLKVGAKKYIPIRYAMTSTIKFRPYGVPYNWSKEMIKCTSLKREFVPLSFGCPHEENSNSSNWLFSVDITGERTVKDVSNNNNNNNNNNSEGFMLNDILTHSSNNNNATTNVAPSGASTITTNDSGTEVVISLTAPLKIENALPEKLRYLVKGPNGEDLTNGLLPPGANAEIFHVIKDHRPILLFALDGFLWSTPIKIGGTTQTFVQIESQQKRILSLGIDNITSNYGARFTTVYVKYWIYNKTGSLLKYRNAQSLGASSNVKTIAGESKVVSKRSSDFEYPVISSDFNPLDDHDDEDAKYIKPFIFSSDMLSVRKSTSAWSNPIYLKSNGGIFEILKLGEKKKPDPLHSEQLSVSIHAAPGKFWRTNIVKISPRFIFINRTGNYQINVRQAGGDKTITSLYIGEQTFFDWSINDQPKLIQFTLINNSNEHSWSSPFSIEAADSFQVPIWKQGDVTPMFVRITINLTDSSVTVIFLLSDDDYPDYRIENYSSYPIIINEVNGSYTYKAPPEAEIPFAWSYQLSPKKQVVLSIPHTLVEAHVTLDKLKLFPLITWTSSTGLKNHLSVEVIGDGPTKVLVIDHVADEDVERFEQRIRVEGSLGNKKSSQIQAKYSQSALDKLKNQQNEISDSLFSMINLAMSYSMIGFSVIDEKPQELLYLSMRKIEIIMCITNETQSIELNVGSLQIDNQLYHSPYPLFLYSPPIESQPFFQFSIIRSSKYSNIMYIPYFAIKMQKFDVQLDELFLLRILNFVDLLSRFVAERHVEDDEIALFTTPPTFYLKSTDFEVNPTMLYFDILHINPIAMNITFATLGAPHDHINGGFIEKTLRAGGFLASIENAPIKLNGLILQYPFISFSKLLSRIMTHYSQQFIREFYLLLGSADVLGSPVSLVSSLGTGVYDFFHEPAEGIVNSPQEFAIGLTKGTTSLIKNSVFGVFNSVSKISGTISKAAATFSLDEEWQRARAKKMMNKPQHVGQGISKGVKSFGFGVYEGVTGVVSQPIKGFNKEGGMGLVKGMGKGVTGLFLRPVVGVVDLFTDTTEGIKNTALMYDDLRRRERIRPPRFFGKDNVLTVYDPDKSWAQYILKTIDNFAYEEQYFIQFVQLSDEKIVFFSDVMMLILVIKTAMKIKKRARFYYTDIIEVARHPEGVIINTVNDKLFLMEIKKSLNSLLVLETLKKFTKSNHLRTQNKEYHRIEDPKIAASIVQNNEMNDVILGDLNELKSLIDLETARSNADPSIYSAGSVAAANDTSPNNDNNNNNNNKNNNNISTHSNMANSVGREKKNVEVVQNVSVRDSYSLNNEEKKASRAAGEKDPLLMSRKATPHPNNNNDNDSCCCGCECVIS